MAHEWIVAELSPRYVGFDRRDRPLARVVAHLTGVSPRVCRVYRAPIGRSRYRPNTSQNRCPATRTCAGYPRRSQSRSVPFRDRPLGGCRPSHQGHPPGGSGRRDPIGRRSLSPQHFTEPLSKERARMSLAGSDCHGRSARSEVHRRKRRAHFERTIPAVSGIA